ncbi:MAG: hypothetical protein H0T79_00410 [Deltaproteobacteria bacterium]|nr:hypothetical protein [Deltaproteobacteria bacterium]
MQPDDLTLRVLIEIRDGISQTNLRLDQTNLRLDQTRAELREEIAETNRRLVGSEVRVATAIDGLAGTLGDVHRLLQDRRDIDTRVTRCETEIDELKRRVG